MGASIDDFCLDSTAPQKVLLAFSITYTPIMIYALKVSRGRLLGLLHLLIFVNCAFTFGYMVFVHFSSTNRVALTMGAAIALLWGCYSAIETWRFITSRCRLCLLGRKYILAPAHHVESSAGFHPVTPSDNHAFVVRKPGLTTVNGTLVPGLKSLVLGGRRAVKQGVVNLVKYAK
ncbi:M [RtClon arterivirus]|uniref:M n=1 Tax=RtClon arterivirus TaxID=2847272 RepID=A0A1L6Z3P8_9NIDO|nr:M [Rat arterivirus 1] [Rat arterivirus 1]APT40627.1 M [RtClon arterivirus] [RtClon arterivirus]